jgi:hypothetical protein
MKRQSVHTLFPFNGVHTNHWCFDGKLDRRYNRVELGHIKIAIELLARLPVLNEHQVLSVVQIHIEARIQTSRRNPRWPKDRPKCAQ